MAELDEKYLITQCQRNDLTAFNELVLRYQDRIFNVLYRMLDDQAAALDISQESFLRAFQSINKFKGQSSFLTWVYQIAVNLCYNYKRDQKQFSTLPPDDLLGNPQPRFSAHSPTTTQLSTDPAISLESAEQTRLIQQAINSLAPDLRAVIVFKDIEGQSYEKISRVLKCSIGSVRTRLAKARTILKDKLSKLI